MTITHEGKTYEVLSLDRIDEITHAKLAGGKVVSCELRNGDAIRDLIWLFHDGGQYGVYVGFLQDLGIQPLRLVPKEPMTFEATFAKDQSGYWHPMYGLDCGFAYQGKEQRKFRCVEIVEEA